MTARLMDIPHLMFIWLFTLSLFQPNFILKPIHILIGSVYSGLMLWIRLSDFGIGLHYPVWFIGVISIMSAAIAIHLCATTLIGRADDLLIKRRASRIYFVIVIASVTILSAISEPFLQYSNWLFTTKILIIWPAIVWCFFWITSFNQKAVAFADDRNVFSTLSERDKILKDKLIYEMTHDLGFKKPDLTIISLASKLGIHHHRLRSLINQALGYKNFSEFVNSYRIAAAKDAISAPQNEGIPILTLALDSGFKSLSSFNRIFKNSEKMTPSEFRSSCR